MNKWSVLFIFQRLPVRLQEISEEMRSRCPQRKRSSSLPVPKIEVSLCSETKTGAREASKKDARRNDDVTPAVDHNTYLGTLDTYPS